MYAKMNDKIHWQNIFNNFGSKFSYLYRTYILRHKRTVVRAQTVYSEPWIPMPSSSETNWSHNYIFGRVLHHKYTRKHDYQRETNEKIQEIYRHIVVVSANKLYLDAVCIVVTYISGDDAACYDINQCRNYSDNVLISRHFIRYRRLKQHRPYFR